MGEPDATRRIGQPNVVMKVVDELISFENHHLEVAVSVRPEVRLDDRARSRGAIADPLRSLPRQADVGVVVKPVPEFVARPQDDFEVAVIAAAEVALDNRPWSRRHGRKRLAIPPLDAVRTGGAEHVVQLSVAEQHRFQVAVVVGTEVALNQTIRADEIGHCSVLQSRNPSCNRVGRVNGWKTFARPMAMPPVPLLPE